MENYPIKNIRSKCLIDCLKKTAMKLFISLDTICLLVTDLCWGFCSLFRSSGMVYGQLDKLSLDSFVAFHPCFRNIPWLSNPLYIYSPICAVSIFNIIGSHVIGLYFLGVFPFFETFGIKVNFPFVIHCEILAFCKCFCKCWANPLWKEINFSND